MLHPEKVHAALIAKQNLFTSAQNAASAERIAFEKALLKLAEMDLEACNNKLSAIKRPGARPTDEFDEHGSLIVPFEPRWPNHAQARAWARSILEGVPTFAVDGSQIAPSKDLSIPIGLIQIGWFENYHQPGGKYIKDVAIELLSPTELGEEAEGSDELGAALVNMRRFEMEIGRIAEYLPQRAGMEPKPLALFDGTLIISFAGLMQSHTQSTYSQAVIDLLETSNKTNMPLAGYVDSSSAHDLVDMISHLTGERRSGQIDDATLFQSQMGWGDRTQVFICLRDDNLAENEYYDSVCFCYLKTTAALAPARVEFPRWIFEAGEHERLLDLIRAECIIGNGYPYALETADALAVIELRDRERFYRLVQRFATEAELDLQFTRKSISKRGRRA